MEDTPLYKLDQLRNQGHKLKLNKFHRYLGKDEGKKRKKNNYVSNKKKIRDIERLINRPGMPQEIIDAKKKELTELKSKERYKFDAKVNFSKYKQIRFHERKKCDRKIKKVKKTMEEVENRQKAEDQEQGAFDEQKQKELSELKEQLKAFERDLEYICHFPANHKYISLYTTNEMPEETLKKREDLRRIVRCQVQAREAFKKREMKQIDKEGDMEVADLGLTQQTQQTKLKDRFFVSSDDEADEKPAEGGSEEPKAQETSGKKEENKGHAGHGFKNTEKNNRKRTRKDKQENKQNKPLKIKARTYRATNVNMEGVKDKLHIKF